MPALHWLAGLSLDTLDLLPEDLVAGILNSSWQALSEPEILEAFVNLLIGLTHRHVPLTRKLDDFLSLYKLDAKKRRALLATLISRLGDDKDPWIFAYHWTLVLPEDIDWLAAKLDDLKEEGKKGLVSTLIVSLLSPFDRKPTKRAGQIAKRHSILRAKLDARAKSMARQRRYKRQSKKRREQEERGRHAESPKLLSRARK